MIFIKSIGGECLLDDSILKLFIYSDTVGFFTEEKIKLFLNPKYYYFECTIPISQVKSFIECKMDVVKFPIIKYGFTLPNEFPSIENCNIFNWENIEKDLSAGSCYKNYSLKFSPFLGTKQECYQKNYNAFIIKGKLYNESSIGNIKRIYTFSLSSLFNGSYYDTILCEIYPPDSTYSEFRMFCYTNKTDKVDLFPTIAIDVNSQENIYIAISNNHFDLLDCSSIDKTIYFKNVNYIISNYL